MAGREDPVVAAVDPIAWAEFDGVEDASEKRANDQQNLSKLVSQKIRDEWIRDQMKSRQAEFTNHKDLRVFVGTWNVNGKKPSESIDAWLGVGGSTKPPDVYVLGFQEMVDLTAGNVVMDSASSERCKLWVETIAYTLSRMYQNVRYSFMTSKFLVGIMLCVFVLEEHRPFLPQVSVQTAVTATGVMGMGNKGGVAIRFQLYDTTFCFVCAHLAAHREAIDARNSDYRNIMSKTAFKDDVHAMSQRRSEERLSCPVDATLLVPDGQSSYRKPYEAISGPASGNGSSQVAPYLNSGNTAGNTPDSSSEDLNLSSLNLAPILSDSSFGIIDHDYVFWLGDFNYRIHMDHSTDTVFFHVDANNLQWLRDNDQLLIEQSLGRVFLGFKEAEIQFLPTYKYQPGTNQYDRRPEKKIRAPAYCDRILWRDVNGSYARILKYMSCPTLCLSDHKPVYAFFETRIREKVPNKRSTVFQDIIRQLDKWENDERPQIRIDRNAISFEGGLSYMERREETVTLTNTGRIPVTWRFVPKLEDLTISKHWLHLEPNFGLLTAGSSCTVKLVALVDHFAARKISSGMDILDDILVLRLENGQDHFICVSATLIPTCFGVDLNKLVRTHAPFAAPSEERELVIVDRIARYGEEKAKMPLRFPKELWWLCNFLWIYDLLKTPSLFVLSRQQASSAKLAKVRRCINYGHELVPDDEGHGMAHAVAAVIIEFLEALPEPVVPLSLFPKVDVENVSMEAWGRRFLDQLPPLSHNVFVYVITFLREVIKNHSYNRVALRDLAGIFAQVLMRPNEVAERLRETSPQANMPFDLPNWITGEKKESTLNQLAEKVIVHFLQADRAFLF